ASGCGGRERQRPPARPLPRRVSQTGMPVPVTCRSLLPPPSHSWIQLIILSLREERGATDQEPGQMNEMRVLAPTGVLGSGFLETSFEAALARQPHFIGCDAGSTDPGPSHLGSGVPAFPRAAVKRDLRLALLGARRLNIPLLVGSAGTAGADAHLAWNFDIFKEIASGGKIAFPLALTYAQQDKGSLKRRLRESRIKPLDPAPKFDEETIDRAERFVGMMGAEPSLRELDAGADVVIAGRSSDTAIFVALQVTPGF